MWTARSGLRSLPDGTYVGITACLMGICHVPIFIVFQGHCPGMKLV